MASTYTDLGIELMATGENAGTWGTKTNANLNLIEQLTGGYLYQAVTDSGTPTALTIDNGSLTGEAQNRVIELTGSISGSRVVTFPVNTENLKTAFIFQIDFSLRFERVNPFTHEWVQWTPS